jgi:thioester reductase-like protein
MMSVSMPQPFAARNFVDVLRHWAETRAHECAFRFLLDGDSKEVTLSFAQLDEKARAIAARLQEHGAPGDRVLLLYPQGLDFIAAFMGCLYSGRVAVPAYPPDPARLQRALPKLEALVADAGARVALTSSAIALLASEQFERRPALESMQWIATDLPTGTASSWRPPALHEDALAFLQYTSGSTGTPKGVMISQGNLMHNARAIQAAFGHTDALVGVGWLPLYHDMGLIGKVLQPLYMGRPCTLLSPLAFLKRPARWLKAISRHGATTSGGPNFAYDVCVRKIPPAEREGLDLSRWRVAFVGAEPVRQATLDRFVEAFEPYGFRREAFVPCYGLAESTLWVASAPVQTGARALVLDQGALERGLVAPAGARVERSQAIVSSGSPGSDQRIAIVDPDRRVSCAADQVGEIWLAGPSVARSYWNRGRESEEAFHAHLADGDGPFLRSGDLGFLRDGQLYVTGRVKDLIIVRGKNHYPQDIEYTVERTQPALRAGGVAAFGVDVQGEEQLVLLAELSSARTDRRPELSDLISQLCLAVAEEHEIQPYAVWLVAPGSIPKTSSGKIQRRACKGAYLVDDLKTVLKWSRAELAPASALQSTADVYLPRSAALDKLERRSTRYRFDLERDICWDRLDAPGDHLGPAWLEAYGVDDARLRLHPEAHDLFQWAMALSLCETFVGVEEAIVSFFGSERAALLPSQSIDRFEEEEHKHIALFRRYGAYLRSVRPELTREFDEASTAMVEFHRRSEENSLGEGSIHLYDALAQDQASLKPAWVSVNAAHRQEEIQHVATDAAYVEMLSLSEEDRQSMSRLFVRVATSYFGRLSGLEPAYLLLQKHHPDAASAVTSPQRMPLRYAELLLYSRVFAKTRAAARFLTQLAQNGDAGWREMLDYINGPRANANGTGGHAPPSALDAPAQTATTAEGTLRTRVLDAPVQARRDLVVQHLSGRIAEVTGTAVPQRGNGASRIHLLQLGIDSMAAVELAARLEEDFAVELPVSTAYDSTLGELADGLLQLIGLGDQTGSDAEPARTFASVHGKGATMIPASDLRLERFFSSAELQAARLAAPAAATPRVVLLTGANGFVARYLALELLERLPADGKLVCLVRGENDAAARQRLYAGFGDSAPELVRKLDAHSRQLEVRAGNITRPFLGLDRATYDTLCQEVDSIVHSAGLVNHALTYEQLFEPNVLGTTRLMRMAITDRIKPIHFLSSVALIASLRREGRVFEHEEPAAIWPERPNDGPYASGYGTSKWACELLLQRLHAELGVPVSSYRCGLVLGHRTARGQINADDVLTLLLRAIVMAGSAPKSFYDRPEQRRFPILPVDYVASALAALVVQPTRGCHTYHVVGGSDESEPEVSLDTFVDWIQSAGYPVTRVSDQRDWFDDVRTRLHAATLPSYWDRPVETRKWPRLDATDFHQALRHANFTDEPGVDEAYFHRCLSHLVHLGMMPSASGSS